MPFQKLNFSLNHVDRAGDTLSGRASHMNDDMAWDVLDNWRAAHHLPLHYLAMNVARHARKVDKNALIARRLKRAPSILGKLEREQKMALRRMQDIAGCRVIMPTIDKARAVSRSLQKSTQLHELERVKDYISQPKTSGYRGIHLVYRYQSNDIRNQSWNGRRVEIQIRSTIQHLWATAVEIVGMITQQSLKSSVGTKEWLEFFQLVSAAFNKLDSKQLIDDAECRQITKRAKKLRVQERLLGYSLALKNAKSADADFYLLVIENSELTIQTYIDSQEADNDYAAVEQRLRNVSGTDVVLVGAESFYQLKRAYPNYFGDSERFVKHLDSLMVTRKSWLQW